jgi:hypothetical protein
MLKSHLKTEMLARNDVRGNRLVRGPSGATVRGMMGGAQARGHLNELGRKELPTMPKNRPTTGPMRTQPIERASIMPTPVLPMMPTAGKAKTSMGPKATINKGGRSPDSEGENNAAQLLAEAAGRPEGLVPGVDFPIHLLKKCQAVHRQAMLIFFAIDEEFH